MANKAKSVLLDSMKQWVSYTATANTSEPGSRTGTNGQPWTGSLIAVCAQDSMLTRLPSLTDPTNALAVFTRNGQLYRKPRKGDIVFFAYGSLPNSSPRVGVVSDVRGWRRFGAFKCIEGQAPSGQRRGSQEPNGVYERVHYAAEVLAFARPTRRQLTPITPGTAAREDEPEVSPSVRVANLAAPSKDVELVQLALSMVTVLRGAKRGEFDAATRAAYRDWQRQCGQGSLATGAVDDASLTRLAERTGVFRVSASA